MNRFIRAVAIIACISLLYGCAYSKKNVVLEIDEELKGIFVLVEDPDAIASFEKQSDTYSLSVIRPGIIAVQDLSPLDGQVELSAFVNGNVLPAGILSFNKPVGSSFFDAKLTFEKSYGGPDNDSIGLWKYSPSSIINGVRTYSFFVGTINEAKASLSEMRQTAISSTKAKKAGTERMTIESGN